MFVLICGGSSIWLERRPVTAEVAGSSPVHRAVRKTDAYFWHLFYVLRGDDKQRLESKLKILKLSCGVKQVESEKYAKQLMFKSCTPRS